MKKFISLLLVILTSTTFVHASIEKDCSQCCRSYIFTRKSSSEISLSLSQFITTINKRLYVFPAVENLTQEQTENFSELLLAECRFSEGENLLYITLYFEWITPDISKRLAVAKGMYDTVQCLLDRYVGVINKNDYVMNVRYVKTYRHLDIDLFTAYDGHIDYEPNFWADLL